MHCYTRRKNEIRLTYFCKKERAYFRYGLTAKIRLQEPFGLLTSPEQNGRINLMKPDIDRLVELSEENFKDKDQADVLDPNDTNLLRDRIKGQTKEHARPPRLEDEGQSGG